MVFYLCVYSFEDAMNDLSEKQPSVLLASDQSLCVISFSIDHPKKASIHISDAKLNTIQSNKEPPQRKSVPIMHRIMVPLYKLVLIVGILFIIALFSMPIILFYFLDDSPPESSQTFTEISQVTENMFRYFLHPYNNTK